jgi:hypothetical protein
VKGRVAIVSDPEIPGFRAGGPSLAFAKRYDGLLGSELAKAERLHALARRNGFGAPEVLAVDPDGQVITYEFIPGLQPVRTAYLAYMTAEPIPRIGALFGRVGRALAHIHDELLLPERVDWDPPEEFRSLLVRRLGAGALERLADTPQAFFHGDFGFGNVQFDETADRLVVLDPSPNGYLTTHPSTWGSIYADIGFFVSCLRGLVGPARLLKLRRERIEELEAAFLDGYAAVSGRSLDHPLVDAVAYASAGTYLRSRYTLPLLAPLALRFMFRIRR